MRIITAGGAFLDIDAYAGCIAYAELLQKLGVEARVVSTAVLNESIPQILRDWPVTLAIEYEASQDDTYTLIDLSNPDYFEKFVDHGRIDEIIDHHPGFEEYWQKRIGDGAIIEHVGAACTQIFEKWEQAGILDQISQTSAGLLMCGILDNTLNFGADITCDRDRYAYEQLSKYAGLPDDWPAKYFSACEESVLRDIAHTVSNDTKILDFRTFPRTMALGQCAVWDAGKMAHDAFDSIKGVLQKAKPDWAMNIIDINGNRSFIVSDVPEVKGWFEGLLGIKFDGNVAVANRTWLRKEIMKADINKA